MLVPVESNRFRKDVALMQKRGKDMEKLKQLLFSLVNRLPLPKSYQAHPLQGSWKPLWDAHIEPDWLLLYLEDDDKLYLARTGTHADIFKK